MITLEDDYRKVEWLGGPLDGQVMLVKMGLQSIVYPSGLDLIGGHKNKVENSWIVPIKIINGREYLVWNERS